MTTASPQPSPDWSVRHRFAFWCLAVYFLLYTFPFPLTVLPVVGEWLQTTFIRSWGLLARQIGTGFLGLEGPLPVGPSGSGDLTVDYILLVLRGGLALVLAGAALWAASRLRRRVPYGRLAAWLEVGLRYWLATTLFFYGMVKLIPAQFPEPGLARLLVTFGEASPMRLLWTFMGASPAYTMFSGATEVVAGLLLVWRRTRTLGALVAAGVMAQVLMLNLSYDVPVKLFSAHLLATACGLLWLDRRRLVDFFWRNVPAAPAELRPLVVSRQGRVALWLVAVVLVLSALGGAAVQGWDRYTSVGPDRARSELWGIHEVTSFRVDGEEVPPLLTDEERWKRLVVDGEVPATDDGLGRVYVQAMDDELRLHPVVIDEDADTLTVLGDDAWRLEPAERAELEPRAQLRYRRPSEGELVLEGTWDGREVEILLQERDLDAMALPGARFRWIRDF